MSFRYTGQGVKEITFDSLAKPLMAVQERHDKLEDNMALLNSQAAQYDYIIQQEKERDPNSEIAKKYEGYLNEIKSVADTLATQGILGNTNIRNRVNNLAALYSKEITPISTAHEKRERQIALENELRMKNPNLLLSRTASDHGLKDFMDNTYRTDTLDLTTVMAEGANIGNLLSSISKGEKIDKSLPGYIKIVETLGFDPTDALLKGNTTLDGLVDMYYKNQSSTYNPDIMNANTDVIKNAFTKGIYSTLRETNKSQLTNDKQWDFNKTLELDAIKRKRDFKDQVRIANLNKPDPTESLIPGTRPIVESQSEATAAEARGRIADANNFSIYVNNPNKKFKVLSSTHRDMLSDKVTADKKAAEQELSNLQKKKDKTPEDKAKLKTIEVKINELKGKQYLINSGSYQATGRELADLYNKTFKFDGDDKDQRTYNLLSNKANLFTHTSIAGLELNDEYAEKALPSLLGRANGSLQVLEVAKNGKTGKKTTLKEKDFDNTKGNIQVNGTQGAVYLTLGENKYKLDSHIMPDMVQEYVQPNGSVIRKTVNLIKELEQYNKMLYSNSNNTYNLDPKEFDANIQNYQNIIANIANYFALDAVNNSVKPSSAN